MVRPGRRELAVHGREVVRLERGRDLRPGEVHADSVDARDGQGLVEVAFLDRPVVGPHVDAVGGRGNGRGGGSLRGGLCGCKARQRCSDSEERHSHAGKTSAVRRGLQDSIPRYTMSLAFSAAV